MERINNIALSFLIAILFVMMAMKSDNENIYLIIGYSFVAILNVLLGICYCIPCSSKKWIFWLNIIVTCVALVCLTADFILLRMQ
jgi:hypothetical protein